MSRLGASQGGVVVYRRLDARVRQAAVYKRHGLLRSWVLSAIDKSHPRPLAPAPGMTPMGWSARRLNKLAALLPAARYLEVGVWYGYTLENVRIPERWGVDPAPLFDLGRLPRGNLVFPGSSDEFFEKLDATLRFDLVFLDGLHTWQQTYVDLINSLRHLSDAGAILIDDVIPSDKYSAIPDQERAMRERRSAGILDSRWHGDVFKVLFVVRDHVPGLRWCVIDEQQGNPQALVWRDPKATTPLAMRRVLSPAVYNQLAYHEAFPNGDPPQFFNVTDEDSAIDAYAMDVAKLHQ